MTIVKTSSVSVATDVLHEDIAGAATRLVPPGARTAGSEVQALVDGAAVIVVRANSNTAGTVDQAEVLGAALNV